MESTKILDGRDSKSGPGKGWREEAVGGKKIPKKKTFYLSVGTGERTSKARAFGDRERPQPTMGKETGGKVMGEADVSSAKSTTECLGGGGVVRRYRKVVMLGEGPPMKTWLRGESGMWGRKLIFTQRKNS